jgi:hypothetical protein
MFRTSQWFIPKGVLCVILTISIALSLNATAFAAATTAPASAAAVEEKTYEQRVADLKTYYSVTFVNGSKYDPLVPLGVVEDAVKLIGSRAMHKIAAPWIKKSGQFVVKARFSGFQVASFYDDSGLIEIIYPVTRETEMELNPENVDVLTQKFYDDQLYYLTEALVHEFGHAYDFGLLNCGGASNFTSINGPYGKEYYVDGNFVSGYAQQGPQEDFACTFEQLVFFPLEANTIYNRHDYPEIKLVAKNGSVLFNKCKAVYDMLLRDFGEESTAVKRVSKFFKVENLE